jgi:hypothetical protein
MEFGAAYWGRTERQEWVWSYLAGLPVQLPLPGHPEGSCGHCDALRDLVREVDELLDEIFSRHVTPN